MERCVVVCRIYVAEFHSSGPIILGRMTNCSGLKMLPVYRILLDVHNVIIPIQVKMRNQDTIRAHHAS